MGSLRSWGHNISHMLPRAVGTDAVAKRLSFNVCCRYHGATHQGEHPSGVHAARRGGRFNDRMVEVKLAIATSAWVLGYPD